MKMATNQQYEYKKHRKHTSC